MSDAVVQAARQRLGTALASWVDATGDPHPRTSARMPAYAVGVTYNEAERVSMGAPDFWKTGELVVTLHAERSSFATLAGAPDDGERAAQILGAAVRAAILAAPADLSGAVWDIAPAGLPVEHDAGSDRLVRAEQSFSIRVLERAP